MKKLAVSLTLMLCLVPKFAAAQDPLDPCLQFGNICGSLDAPTGGWALDKTHPTDLVRVEVYAFFSTEVVQIYSQPTSVLRPDVNLFFRTTGSHGFGYQIPDAVKVASNGQQVTIMAY